MTNPNSILKKNFLKLLIGGIIIVTLFIYILLPKSSLQHLDTSGLLCAKKEYSTGSNDYIFIIPVLCNTPDQEISQFMIPECFSYKFADYNKDGIKDLKLREKIFLPFIRSCENPEGAKSKYYLINKEGNIEQP